MKFMEADTAAQLMLKGIARNKAIITMPAYTGLLWRLNRLSPGLINLLSRKTISDFRKIAK